MPNIIVDGTTYEVKEGRNLLHACLSLGLDIPYFCWHPAIHSVGACRQCAVKQFRDANDTKGRIVMACMTPAEEGTRISIEDPEAKDFRARVIEWLMIGHPHDCPVCDEGGECHLQDMTVMTGHTYRRYRFRKRTFANQDLGPFLNHEMNRCIACYRCVRFYREYAGGRDLAVLSAHHHVYFGRHRDGVLESPFSGNLVEVCPTGVFTDKTLKAHYTRKWDLTTAPSVCVHCGTGCNTIPGARYGGLRRILNRYHEEVNGYFLCDRGRFGYGFVNGDRRIRHPALRPGKGDALRPASPEQVLGSLGRIFPVGARAIGIGSPRASLEANHALRTLVGPGRFFSGMSGREARLVSAAIEILREGPAPAAAVLDAERADALFVLGEDVGNTAPRLALALRQSVLQAPRKIPEKLGIPEWHDGAVRTAIQDERGPLYVASPCATPLDDVAARTFRAAPADLARLGFAVAHAVRAASPSVPEIDADMRALAEEIARALAGADRPLVVSGAGSGDEAVMRAAANVAWALRAEGRPAGLCLALPECNSMGAGLLGGGPLDAAFRAIADGEADTVVVLENDLYRRAASGEVDAFLSAAKTVIVVDHTLHGTAERADILLPAGSFAESSGTLVSNEGRAQRFLGVFRPEGETRESWRWLRDLLDAAGRPEGKEWRILDDVTAACSAAVPQLSRVPEACLPAGFRIHGQRIPREPRRFSGRTAMHARESVHEPKAPDDPDSPLSFTMEGHPGIAPPPLVTHYWAPAWNSVQALNKFQSEVGGPLRGGNPGVRLLAHPSPPGEPRYSGEIPARFEPRPDAFLVIPLHHVFGSEEQSALAPPVARRSPGPYLAVRPDDASRLGLPEGPVAVLSLGEMDVVLPVRYLPDLPAGVAGVPAGITTIPGVPLPAWGRISGGPGS